MTRSELIDLLRERCRDTELQDIAASVQALLNAFIRALAAGQRIEIRGFGVFSCHRRAPRMARNPKSGDRVAVPGKYVVHFRPGKELRQQLAQSVPGAASLVDNTTREQ